MKVNIYIWRRELITKPGGGIQFKYGAELTWPTEGEDEWYRGYWVYTPLFENAVDAEQAAEKLARIIEENYE